MKKWLQKLTRPRWKLLLLIPVALLLLAFVSLEITIRSDWFRDYVHALIVEQAERATGGTASLDSFDIDRARFSFVVRGLTIRGGELDSEPPFLRFPEIRLRISVRSWLGRRIVLETLHLAQPEIHVSIREDGSSNVPRPSVTELGDSRFSDALLNLAVRDLVISNGLLVWNQLSYPLDLSAKDCLAHAVYETNPRRYRADVAFESIALAGPAWLPPQAGVRAELNFYADRLAARNIHLEIPGVRIDADADLRGFSSPSAQIRYRADLDLAAAYRQPAPLTAGSADLEGIVSWRSDSGQVLYAGRARATGVAAKWNDRAISDLAARADFSGDLAELALHDLEIHVFGGSFVGDGGLRNLAAAAGPKLWMRGDVDDFQLQAVLAALPLQEQLPVSRFGLAGKVRAWFRAEASSLDDLDLALSLIFDSHEVTAPGPGVVPVDGVIDVTYSGQRRSLGLARFDLLTPSTEVVADGDVQADGRSNLEFSISLADLDDVRTMLALAGIELPEPTARLLEPATIEGRLQGNIYTDRAPAVDIISHIKTGAFEVGRLRWDRLAADVSSIRNRLEIRNARIEGYGGAASGGGAVTLSEGGLDPNQPLEARATVEGIAIHRLLAALGMPQPVKGALSANFQLGGASAAPTVAGEFSLTAGSALGLPFDRLSGRARLDGAALRVDDVAWRYQDGAARGGLRYATDTREFDFNLSAPSWELAQWAPALGVKTPISGVGSVELKGEGRLAPDGAELERLSADGDWRLAGIALNHQPLGDWSGRIESAADEIRLNWSAMLAGGRVTGETTIDPKGVAPFQGSVNAAAAAVGDVLRMAGIPTERLEGEIDLSATFSGAFTDLPSLKAEGTIDRLEAGLPELPGASRGFKVWNPFPMRFRYGDGALRLDRMRLLGDGTDVEISGTLPLDDAQEINIELDGAFNLAAVESFRPDLRASGQAIIQTTILGVFDDPEISGRLELRNAALRSVEFANGLSDLNGRVNFAGGQARILNLTATSGGGTLRISGFSNLRGDSVDYRLNATASRVRLRYPENITSLIDGELSFSGTAERSLLEGEIIVLRASTRENIQLGRLLASLAEPATTPPSSTLLRNLQYNVQVTSAPELEIDTAMIRNLEAEVDMRLVGSYVNPSVLGRVSVNQGELRFQGTRYYINRGDVDFVNPFRVDPVVNFELETRVRDVDIALTLSGPARNLNVTYRSDPPLPFSDLVNLIAVGRAPTIDPVLAARQRVEQQSLFQSGANNVLSSALSNPSSGRLQRFFGVSRLKVDPQIGGAEANPSARLSTEQQITSDLTLTYSYDLSSAQQQVVRVEWAPDRRWSFIVTRDENGLVGADVLYKLRLR